VNSWFKERPDTQCDTLLSYLLQERAWLPQDKVEAVKEISFESFVKRAVANLNYSRATMYVHGDEKFEKDKVIQLRDNLLSIIGPTIEKSVLQQHHDQHQWGIVTDAPNRAKLLEKGSHSIILMPAFNPEDANSALVTFFQTENVSPKLSALLMVIRRVLAEPLFAELRTKQQLGYIVSLATTGHGYVRDTILYVEIDWFLL